MYCSRQCVSAAHRKPVKDSQTQRLCILKRNRCIECGREFISRHKRACCSEECKEQRKQKVKALFERNRQCKRCGMQFRSRGNKKLYCSSQCCDLAALQRRDKRVSKCPVREDIFIENIIKRDNGICHICSLPVVLNVDRVKHLLSPTIDHVVPVSLGGNHTVDNVKLAHRICNSVRGNKPLTIELSEICNRRVIQHQQQLAA